MKRRLLQLIWQDKEILLGGFIAVSSLFAELIAMPENVVAILLKLAAMLALLGLLIHRFLEIRRIHLEKHVPFLVVIGKDDSQYRSVLGEVRETLDRDGIKLDALERHLNLENDDWIYREKGSLPVERDAWAKCLRDVERHFWRLAEKVQGRKAYYFFLVAPAAFAVGLGSLVGRRIKYTVHHYQVTPENRNYWPQIDFCNGGSPEGPHIIGTHVPPSDYQYITTHIRNEPSQGAIYVAGDFVRHIAPEVVAQLAQQDGAQFVAISSAHKWGGTIPLSADWIRLSQEFVSTLLELHKRSNVHRIHLYIGLPIAIAFAVGAGIGPLPVSVHSWMTSQGDYKEVVNLDDI